MRSIELDHRSPVPLYHQLAEALRYRIATGELVTGASLPSLRRAAVLWGVNLHTVRRAYAELAAQALIATRGPAGTRVLRPLDGRPPGPRDARRDRFLARVLKEAGEKHGLRPAELAALLHPRSASRTASSRVVHIVECSRTQCEDLSRQLEARWRVTAVPWPLDREDPPPAAIILATYFHYNDVRVRFAARLSNVRFAAIGPDPALRSRLRPARRRARGRLSVLLCERDPSMARNIAADLSRILPEDEFEIRTEITARPEHWLKRKRPRRPILFAPRIWGSLSEAARNRPQVHEVRYVFDLHDCETIGREFGWQAR